LNRPDRALSKSREDRTLHHYRACAIQPEFPAVTRTTQRSLGRGLIAALLYAQMMVAAYACPALAPAGAAERPPTVAAKQAVGFVAGATQQVAAMPAGCDGMPIDSPNVCVAHCQAGDQNIDAAQTPVAPVYLSSSFYVVPVASASGECDRNATPIERINAIPPPHAILHCCFRI
jgi:hypothetical protein